MRSPVLIRDEPAWWYVAGFNHMRALRRLRLYAVEPGRLVAVITERGDGPSITNAVRDVHVRLAAEYPDHITDVVEHYPGNPGAVGGAFAEHFDLVTDPWGEQGWRRLSLAELIGWIGVDPSEQEAVHDG